MRVLIAEGDDATRELVALTLRSRGYSVEATGSGDEAVELVGLFDFDILLLAAELPDQHGFGVIKAIRTAKKQTPVLIYSDLFGVDDIVKALSLGADDFMPKPFHIDEMLARVQAIVRRWKGHARSVLTIGGLSLDLDAKTATIDGRRLELTGKEYQMLELLALRQGKTLTKEMFLDHLYSGRDEPELKIIDVFICKLRKKLLAASSDGRSFIETIWGRGYLLRDPDMRMAA